MMDVRFEAALDPTVEAFVRKHFAGVLGDLTCPAHGERLQAVQLLGQWPHAMQVHFTACCDALRFEAKRALGLPADDPRKSGPRAAVSARKTDEWEIAAVGPLATSIAELFAKRSVHGRPHDPPLHVSMIRQATNATDEQLIEAISELEGLRWVLARRVAGAEPFGYNIVVPTERLFERVDLKTMGWDPTQDAVRVAGILMTADQAGLESRALAERLEWEPRRLNPALSYLVMNDFAAARGKNTDRLYVTASLAPNARTRQFAQSGA